MPAEMRHDSDELAYRLNAALRTIALNHKTLRGYALDTAGLHGGQEWVLEALRESSPRSHAELAAWMGCEPPTVTATVSKLEAAGLVSRNRRAGDARVVDVEITDAGRAVLDDVRDQWVAVAEDTAGDLSGSEARELTETLERLAQRLRARREERSRERRG